MRERAGRHGIELRLDVAADVGDVLADPLRFKQVVLNLLSNAVKFTPDGGTGDRWPPRSRPTSCRVTVTDTGVGVPPEDRERIFESFQQGGRGATRGGGHRARPHADASGSWSCSAAGCGSTPPSGRAAPSGSPCRSPRGSRRDRGSARDARPVLLLVDDDRASLDLIAAYLDGSGVDIVRVPATAPRRSSRPGGCIPPRSSSTSGCPSSTGGRCSRTSSPDAATADIPVVVVSIVDEPSRGRSLGAAAYLTKPVRRESLLTSLRTAGVPLPPTDRPAALPDEVAP